MLYEKAPEQDRVYKGKYEFQANVSEAAKNLAKAKTVGKDIIVQTQELKKNTESITDANLILLKLCSDEIHSHYDAWKRAGEIGLPKIEGFKTTTLKTAKCPYLKEIKKAFEEKRSFNYHWRGSYDYSAEGRLEDSGEFNAWFSMEYKGCGNGHYYLLLDGMHAIFAEDD